jgi:hypothetical protein
MKIHAAARGISRPGASFGGGGEIHEKYAKLR